MRSIGVDALSVQRLQKAAGMQSLDDAEAILDSPNAFTRRTFSSAERRAAAERTNVAQYLASCFAIKEALYKAFAPLIVDGRPLDMRKFESGRTKTGVPVVVRNALLEELCGATGVKDVLVTLTHEQDFVMAFVALN